MSQHKNVSAEEIIKLLDLKPHPEEGGFFSETYRSGDKIAELDRCFSTTIYYLITPNTYSAMHRVKSDETFHFYLGDPVDQLQLYPDGSGKIVTIGNNLVAGERPQVLVPRGVWQGARLKPGGSLALFGCTVAPGFEFADYEHGNRANLIQQFPKFKEQIVDLTR